MNQQMVPENFLEQMSNMMEAGNQAGNLEYMQMFNQFYQLFSQLQTLQA